MNLSNVMSLAPEIDEVSHVVQNPNYDLVCITESWLRQHIPDSVIAINGCNVIRRDRKEATHGEVCMYIKETIPFSVLDLSEVDVSLNLEVLSAKLRPTRLPRGFSSIIIKITISIIKITNSNFLGLPSSYRTVCYWTVCYWTVCYWTVCYWTVCYWTVCYWTVCYWTVCYRTVCYRTVQ